MRTTRFPQLAWIRQWLRCSVVTSNEETLQAGARLWTAIGVLVRALG